MRAKRNIGIGLSLLAAAWLLVALRQPGESTHPDRHRSAASSSTRSDPPADSPTPMPAPAPIHTARFVGCASVVVVSEDQIPIAGATVTWAKRNHRRLRPGLGSTFTDEQGWAPIPAREPSGDYVLVYHRDFQPGGIRDVAETGSTRVTLRRGHSYAIEFRTRSGRPVESATAVLSQAAVSESMLEDGDRSGTIPSSESAKAVFSATSDLEGVATIRGIPSGHYQLVVGAAGYVPFTVRSIRNVIIDADVQESVILATVYCFAVGIKNRPAEVDGWGFLGLPKGASRRFPMGGSASLAGMEDRLRRTLRTDAVMAFVPGALDVELSADEIEAVFDVRWIDDHHDEIVVRATPLAETRDATLVELPPRAASGATADVRVTVKRPDGTVLPMEFNLHGLRDLARSSRQLMSGDRRRVPPGDYVLGPVLSFNSRLFKKRPVTLRANESLDVTETLETSVVPVEIEIVDVRDQDFRGYLRSGALTREHVTIPFDGNLPSRLLLEPGLWKLIGEGPVYSVNETFRVEDAADTVARITLHGVEKAR